VVVVLYSVPFRVLSSLSEPYLAFDF